MFWSGQHKAWLSILPVKTKADYNMAVTKTDWASSWGTAKSKDKNKHKLHFLQSNCEVMSYQVLVTNQNCFGSFGSFLSVYRIGEKQGCRVLRKTFLFCSDWMTEICQFPVNFMVSITRIGKVALYKHWKLFHTVKRSTDARQVHLKGIFTFRDIFMKHKFYKDVFASITCWSSI